MGEVRRFRMASDYFTADGLETLAGVSRHQYEAFILKELLDNALDATENRETRTIEVRIEPAGDDIECLSVFDNGLGISGRLLDQIYAQFDSYVSSKKGYRTPTRGYQGNALKTVIGICAVREFDLAFLTREGERVAYTLDHGPSGEIGFRRKLLGRADSHGVVLTGRFRDLSKDDVMPPPSRNTASAIRTYASSLASPSFPLLGRGSKERRPATSPGTICPRSRN